MSSYRSEIGSLAMIFAFEAAGRLGSFTAAAEELGVSQAAVSKQIGFVEERLGISLFFRRHRRVELTADGQRLFSAANAGLSSIASTMQEIRETGRRPLTILLSISLSRFWLMRVLPEFTRQHPEIAVRIISQDDLGAAQGAGTDIVIRYGDVLPENGIRLFGADVMAMASPRFIERHPMTTPEDVLTVPLIHYDTPDREWIRWEDWRLAAGLTLRLPSPAISVSRYQDAFAAAQQDQGILLAWNVDDVAVHAADGLVPVPGPRIRVPGSFYMQCGPERRAEVEAMVQWLRLRQG
ncbi:LysR substrate-binding domain-containing protein [Mesorhizobium sp. DCY119]|uniref:LysR substrate-binding domain-containing protein n=1 Tax=Mesorhizobium sp. DCY119 TaxID=2108445 RepID=UPI000E74F2FB|nr:LysR substrate-binding domain-containing protein [Mesorhizobium sp. DCY119]RJG40497.1 LysR family transcriptional regulator [Mesorhizobium sp. DCY119]